MLPNPLKGFPDKIFGSSLSATFGNAPLGEWGGGTTVDFGKSALEMGGYRRVAEEMKTHKALASVVAKLVVARERKGAVSEVIFEFESSASTAFGAEGIGFQPGDACRIT